MSDQRERIELLRGICQQIASRPKSESVRFACERLALVFRDHTYSDGQKAKLSSSTLKRIFYRWDQTGRPDGALKTFYKGGTLRDIDLAAMFEAFCWENPEVQSFREAYNAFQAEWLQLRSADIPVTVGQLQKRLGLLAPPLAIEFAKRRRESKRSKMPQDETGGVKAQPRSEKSILNALSTQDDAVSEVSKPRKGGV